MDKSQTAQTLTHKQSTVSSIWEERLGSPAVFHAVCSNWCWLNSLTGTLEWGLFPSGAPQNRGGLDSGATIQTCSTNPEQHDAGVVAACKKKNGAEDGGWTKMGRGRGGKKKVKVKTQRLAQAFGWPGLTNQQRSGPKRFLKNSVRSRLLMLRKNWTLLTLSKCLVKVSLETRM